jgi:lauroyl/myristoyl acyltransferase
MAGLLARFLVRGVFWRQFLRWAVANVPGWIEAVVIGSWSLFFLLWGPGRRGVMRNLTAILPGSTAAANFLRCYRVFWNYAWTITENARFHELHAVPDWQLEGFENLEAMESGGGAILLTAHMGSYDLGAYVFAEISSRRIVMVRAPERDPATGQFEAEHAGRAVEVELNTEGTELALDLLHALRDGALAAIQGDRIEGKISGIPVTLFGKAMEVPAGPFALAMTARVPIYPIFVMRRGRRLYRLRVDAPIVVTRSRDRNADLAKAAAAWSATLESVIRDGWYQWFAFEPFSPELAR